MDLGAEMPWELEYPGEPYDNQEIEESDALQEPSTANGTPSSLLQDETGLHRDCCVLADRFSGHPSAAVPIHNRSDLSDAESRVNGTIHC